MLKQLITSVQRIVYAVESESVRRSLIYMSADSTVDGAYVVQRCPHIHCNP